MTLEEMNTQFGKPAISLKAGSQDGSSDIQRNLDVLNSAWGTNYKAGESPDDRPIPELSSGPKLNLISKLDRGAMKQGPNASPVSNIEKSVINAGKESLSSEINLGQDLAVHANRKDFAVAKKAHDQIEQNLVQAIDHNKSLGKDTSKLEAALREHQIDEPTEHQFGAEKVSGKKLAGDIIGTALDVGTAGLLPGAGEAADIAIEQGLKQAVKTGAKTGATYGAVQGLSGGLQKDESAGGIIGSTLLGAGVGAASGGALGGGSVKAGEILDNTAEKGLLGATKDAFNPFSSPFDRNLENAEKSIFPKLTPKEKTSVATKEESGLLGKRSVPDLVNDPKTRPIIESVSNLPDDIRLKPSDSITTKEDKLNQGISRLNQGTRNYLAEPEVKKATEFPMEKYDAYMKERVLDPVESEYGVDSLEYRNAQKAVNTSKSLISTPDGEGVHVARQQFDSQFKKENPRAFKKAGTLFAQTDPHVTSVIESGIETRNAMNDFTQDLLPENNPYRSRLREESNLIRAKEEMRKRSSGDLGKSSTERFLSRNPKVKATGKAATDVLKLGTGVSVLGHF